MTSLVGRIEVDIRRTVVGNCGGPYADRSFGASRSDQLDAVAFES